MKAIILALLISAFCFTAVAQMTDKQWQAKAVEKYPALGVQGSELNKRFIDTYTNRRKTNPNFFTNPQWPLILADELAGVSPVTAPETSTTRPAEPATAIAATPQPIGDSARSPAPRPLPSSVRPAPARSITEPSTPTGLPLLGGGILIGLVVVVGFVIVASLGKPQTPNQDDTLWIGHSSQWNYFWSWVFGILLLVVGVGFLIIIGIVIDRARRVYIVTNKKVIFQFGLFAKSTNEVRIKDIRSINVTKSGIAGLMGIGSVEFSSAATDRAEIIFANISDADTIRDMVSRIQETT